MSIEKTFKKIQEDIEKGDLGKARDRLHSLIFAYPDEIPLRRKLAEIYSILKFPSMAGRYWYLEEIKNKEMEIAIEIFEKSCGKDPLKILFALKFRGNIDKLPKYSKDKLLKIQLECKNKYGAYPVFGLKGIKRWEKNLIKEFKKEFFPFLILFIIIFLIFVGLITVFKWIF